MHLNCETILDFYTRKDRRILCQIKVIPSKHRKFKNTCRCLTEEQWKTFDKELERLVTTTDDWNDEKCLKFSIKPYIEVKVKKSKLPLKHFYESLGAVDEDGERDIGGITEANFVLECLLDFQLEIPSNSSLPTEEYEPQSEVSSDGKVSSPLTYEPYTPSKKKYRVNSIDTVKTPGIDFLDYNEDTYSPKPLSETVDCEPLSNEAIPKYTPAPIKTTCSLRESQKHDFNEIIAETDDENVTSEKTKSSFKSLFSKKSKKTNNEYTPNSQEINDANIPVYIPTPIPQISQTEASKTKNIRIFKKRSKTIDEPFMRSKTIDEMPAKVVDNRNKLETKEKPSNKSEPTNEWKAKTSKVLKTSDKSKSNKLMDENHELKQQKKDNETKSKSRSASSEDEFLNKPKETKNLLKTPTKNSDDEFEKNRKVDKKKNKYSPEIVANIPVYIPTPIKQATQTECSKTNEIRKFKKRSKTIDERMVDKITNEFADDLKKLETKDKTYKLDPVEECKAKTFNKFKPTDNSKTYKYMEKKHELKEDKKHNLKHGKKYKLGSSLSEDEDLLQKSKNSQTKARDSGDEFEKNNEIDKKKDLSTYQKDGPNLCISSATESATDTSPLHAIRGRESKEYNLKPIRRSQRSPSKPKRWIEEQIDFNKNKTIKRSKNFLKNKEIFGTDDDDDDNDDFENNHGVKGSGNKYKTPISKKPPHNASSSSSSSAKKKRKRDRSSECEQEKRDITKWLSKKKTSSPTLDKDTSKSTKDASKYPSKFPPLKTYNKEKSSKGEKDTETHTTQETPTSTFELPSKKEMELMRNKAKLTQEENAKVKAVLDKMMTSPPKEVEILSLQDIPLDDILNTFPTHKLALDEIYDNYHKRDYIKGHGGINHCFVIKLLQPNIQMKMLGKLTEVYSNTKNSSTEATLFANALLPEWIIRVYMETFNFTRQQAINQIQAQEKFQLHMEEQSDNSFMFD